ncbi:hypothetical protein PF005_g16226 [Phytophthora fragariae]|uniref:Uncharacterized protein n=1 Tax=Phytophthora fragariae TaxID=53985 RepID=A0A6A3YAG5_9STRA|nr:hypothetical protein PF009_g17511 [Phytophthora fragariae]KAE9098331.1 hypothetical protein PF007_g16308 [Phytophthora fragariae]KAE9098481.1 hypothetical protein PF010_g15547 [Phytophthora fragariae]KAE9131596.1 hypothetical protein PF006_g15472 [Phytophthora fragariae]KAE9198211.1 hypothetical protein PF005_g16226 [Phytophthora fragariae]
MMHQAKLMSPKGLAAAKQEIHDALGELEAKPDDTQSVYTNLTCMYNAIADHPQAQATVDSTLATQKSVQLLRVLVRSHLREEEVQWALGRIISLACRASIRFQCQAGQLEMWNELFSMRSAHPESIRVQEASLRASESLFTSNEFHITKLRPLLLLEDLLGVMDRFLLVQTPRRRAHGLVVLALRVIVALYSSPRPTGLMLFDGERSSEGVKWAREISKRMLQSFAVFNKDVDAVRSWLAMTLLLLRQYPVQALESLFSPTQSAWWFISVIDRWQSQANVMSSLLATLTHIFALPNNTIGDEIQLALAEKLICEQDLLDIVCGVIDHYRNETLMVLECSVLLEAIRIIRQWSERPALLTRFETSRSVANIMLPVLIDLLDLHAKQSLPSAMSPKLLVFVLEILLILRHLAGSPGLRTTLIGSEKLQTNLNKLLRSRPTSCNSSVGQQLGATARICSAASLHDDGDLDMLVSREARNLHTLMAIGTDVKAAAVDRRGNARNDSIVVSKALEAPHRQLRVAHVRPDTLRAYGCGKR